MKRISVALALCIFTFSGFAQQNGGVGRLVKDIQVSDLNDNLVKLPYLGQKVIMVIFVDPDKKDINEPLYSSIKARKYPKEKYGEVVVINTKDTWYPTSMVKKGAKNTQEKAPEPILLLDGKNTVPNALGLGDCNNAVAVIIVGRDAQVKNTRVIKSLDDSRAAIQPIIKTLDEELAK